MEVLLAKPRGFCAGVDRAIEIVERALELFGAPIYVRMRSSTTSSWWRVCGQSAVFIEDLAEVPSGSTLIFSATAFRKRAPGSRARASRCSTPPARW